MVSVLTQYTVNLLDSVAEMGVEGEKGEKSYDHCV
jgi:hypothetical protein